MAWSLQHLCHIILAAYKEILTVSWKTVVNGCWAQRSDKHAYNQHFLLGFFRVVGVDVVPKDFIRSRSAKQAKGESWL